MIKLHEQYVIEQRLLDILDLLLAIIEFGSEAL